MRKNILYIISFLFLGIQGLYAQNKLFDKLANNDNVTVVYISKALLDMMPNLEATAGNTDLKKLANKLEQIEIYTCDDDSKTIKLMQTEMKALLQDKSYASLMSIKEKDQFVNFFGHKQNDRYKDLIMTVDEGKSVTIIRIKGNFTSDDVKDVIKKTSTK